MKKSMKTLYVNLLKDWKHIDEYFDVYVLARLWSTIVRSLESEDDREYLSWLVREMLLYRIVALVEKCAPDFRNKSFGVSLLDDNDDGADNLQFFIYGLE